MTNSFVAEQQRVTFPSLIMWISSTGFGKPVPFFPRLKASFGLQQSSRPMVSKFPREHQGGWKGSGVKSAFGRIASIFIMTPMYREQTTI